LSNSQMPLIQRHLAATAEFPLIPLNSAYA